ncbi:MAG: DUF4465 domain-containing protein [Bacteroidia bacterium]|nr:DUF4465 domain-containing protein [Bacteroidia bacterium]
MNTNIYTKKIIASLVLALTGIFYSNVTKAQTFTETFETFTLAPNSAYSSTTSSPFVSQQASFEYTWDSGFGYWAGGFAYTNKNDSVTAGFGNLYGVRAGKGFNGSDIYVVGQDKGTIKMTVPQTTVNGFYVTNTTYAYKAMAKGDAFARKFGDTTGTGSGTSIPQGSFPDYFKLIVKGYSNGILKNDSVTIMLADFTFTNNTQDFILAGWQFVNTSSIGAVDSIRFFMRSSDMGSFGINTPLFFAIDNFETTVPNPTGLPSQESHFNVGVYPNPFSSQVNIDTYGISTNVMIKDINGKLVFERMIENQTKVDFTTLQNGVYLIELNSEKGRSVKRIIKN